MPHKMTVIVPNVFKVRKIYPLVLEKWTSLEWTKQNPVSARSKVCGDQVHLVHQVVHQAHPHPAWSAERVLGKSLYFVTASFIYRLTNTEQKGYALSSIFTLENVMKFHQTNTIT